VAGADGAAGVAGAVFRDTAVVHGLVVWLLTHSLYFLLVLISAISEWNKLSQDVRFKPSIASFCSSFLKTPGPVENNFWAMALRYVHRRIFTEEEDGPYARHSN